MERRVTSTDVAREAGLSRATVSYVLNGDPRQQFPEATRQRVLEAAARLGYRPYGPARLLRGARSKVVLVLTPGLEHASDFVAAEIIDRLGDELSKHGLHLVWQLGDTELHGVSMDLAPAVVLSSATEHEDAFTALVQQFSVPVLPAFPGLDAFIAGAAVAQVEYLAETGRRHLAYAAPTGPDLQPTSETRWRAVQQTAAQLGLPGPLRVDVPPEREAAAPVLADLAERHPAVDAICAYNDMVAFTLLAAAHDLGLPVPDRFALIGVDDHPLGPLAIPPLSTVAADVTGFVTEFAAAIARIAAGEEADRADLPTRSQPLPRGSA